jgi:ADP-ribose pyrophosphatase YjhB (NUDIX family)
MPAILNRLTLPLFFTAKALLSPTVLGVLGLVQDKAGRILLARHSYMSGWLMPGGGVARGEPPEHALMRELKEEVGFIRGSEPELIRPYTRKGGWATNVVLLYRVRDAEIDFKPNLEIREAAFFAPDALPEGVTPATRLRIEETIGDRPASPHW